MDCFLPRLRVWALRLGVQGLGFGLRAEDARVARAAAFQCHQMGIFKNWRPLLRVVSCEKGYSSVGSSVNPKPFTVLHPAPLFEGKPQLQPPPWIESEGRKFKGGCLSGCNRWSPQGGDMWVPLKESIGGNVDP